MTAAGREHFEKAERLLDRAAELEVGPRCHHAKVLAAMAQGHAALAEAASVAKIADTFDRLARAEEKNRRGGESS